jgi:hypothetical protein
MGQFKPMVKMMTTEPSVILKLKKGGKVASKAMQSDAFKSMANNNTKVFEDAENGVAPKKPSMAARRKAMNPNMYAKGGKVAHKQMGGMMPATPGSMPSATAPSPAPMQAMGRAALAGMAPRKRNARAMQVRRALSGMKDGGSAECKALEKELKHHEGMSASKAHGKASGGIIMSKTGKTKMVTSKKGMTTGSTGEVKEGKPGGYAKGGNVGVKMGNGGGYKKGGNVPGLTGATVEGGNWENRAANTSKPGVSGTTTGGVKKGNGGGYKMGGSTKKAYATGGTVDTGKPVAMPKKPVSRPIANSLQSGTFKDGGEVSKKAKGGTSTWGGSTPLRLLKTHTGPKGHVAKVYKDVDYGEHRVKFFDPKGKHYKDADYHTDDKGDAHDTAKGQLNRYQNGGEAKKYENESRVTPTGDPKVITDKASRELEEALNPLSMAKEGYQKIKDYFTSKPAPAGSVTKTEKSVTVAPKRSGGRA